MMMKYEGLPDLYATVVKYQTRSKILGIRKHGIRISKTPSKSMNCDPSTVTNTSNYHLKSRKTLRAHI